jgi:hypothetical protein
MLIKGNIRNGLFAAAIAALSVAISVAALAPMAEASIANKTTQITFSAPVEVPGIVLPAGTYTFRILDNVRARNIVQIYNKSNDQLEATLLTVPTYRMKPAGETLLRFQETPSNTPQALKAWWYPGDNFGRQFVYPRKEAVDLAKANNEPVLAMRNANGKNTAASLQNSKVIAVSPSGTDVAADQAVGKRNSRHSSNAKNTKSKKGSQTSASNQ